MTGQIERSHELGPVTDLGLTLGHAFVPHPLAELFPMMSAPELADLTEDVRQHGLREPIIMLGGQVLDGRNRYHAAREAGRALITADYLGDDPVSYVLSLNLHRRHLNESQRGMVAAKLATLPPHRPSGSAPIGALSQDEAAERLSVGHRTVQRAAVVQEHGTAALADHVMAGEVSVSAAAEVARLPEAEQKQVVAAGPAAVVAKAKDLRFERRAAHFDISAALKAIKSTPVGDAPALETDEDDTPSPDFVARLVDVFGDLVGEGGQAARDLSVAELRALDLDDLRCWAAWMNDFVAGVETRLGH